MGDIVTHFDAESGGDSVVFGIGSLSPQLPGGDSVELGISSLTPQSHGNLYPH